MTPLDLVVSSRNVFPWGDSKTETYIVLASKGDFKFLIEDMKDWEVECEDFIEVKTVISVLLQVITKSRIHGMFVCGDLLAAIYAENLFLEEGIFFREKCIGMLRNLDNGHWWLSQLAFMEEKGFDVGLAGKRVIDLLKYCYYN